MILGFDKVKITPVINLASTRRVYACVWREWGGKGCTFMGKMCSASSFPLQHACLSRHPAAKFASILGSRAMTREINKPLTGHPELSATSPVAICLSHFLDPGKTSSTFPSPDAILNRRGPREIVYKQNFCHNIYLHAPHLLNDFHSTSSRQFHRVKTVW